MDERILDQIAVCSLSTPGEEIPLSQILAELLKVDGRRVTALQLNCGDSSLTEKDLAGLTRDVLGIDIFSVQVSTKVGGFDSCDVDFAKRFGLCLIPRLGCIFTGPWRNSESKVEVRPRVGPALVGQDHPLAQKREGRAALIFTEDVSSSQGNQNREYLVPCNGEGNMPPIYLRVRAPDEPSVLEQICRVLANSGINIRRAEQPRLSEGSIFAQIAFVLDPPQCFRFQVAREGINTIRGVGIETILPIYQWRNYK